MVVQQDADRGLQRVLRQAAPLPTGLDGREGIDLAAVADQQVGRSEIADGVVAGGVGLVGLVDQQRVDRAELRNRAAAGVARGGELVDRARRSARAPLAR